VETLRVALQLHAVADNAFHKIPSWCPLDIEERALLLNAMEAQKGHMEVESSAGT